MAPRRWPVSFLPQWFAVDTDPWTSPLSCPTGTQMHSHCLPTFLIQSPFTEPGIGIASISLSSLSPIFKQIPDLQWLMNVPVPVHCPMDYCSGLLPQWLLSVLGSFLQTPIPGLHLDPQIQSSGEPRMTCLSYIPKILLGITISYISDLK
jgi:hypothetical protein